MSSPLSPTADATLLRLGRTTLWQGVWAVIVLLPISLLILGGAASLLARTGVQDAEPVPVVMVALAGLLPGILAVVLVRRGWRARRQLLCLDAAGVWWSPDGRSWTPVWWQSLAGAGIHYSKNGRVWTYTLELLPCEPVDPDHPVLRPFVRQETPHAPGMPDLRYRIRLNWRHETVASAIQAHAPALWFGQHRRPPGHMGKPPRHARRPRMARR